MIWIALYFFELLLLTVLISVEFYWISFLKGTILNAF